MQKIKTIEKLDNFPFQNFQELKKAENEKIVVGIGIDWGVSLKWAHGGIYCPKRLMYYTWFLAILPWLSLIGFMIFLIITKNWRLLLGLPLLPISFFISHPSFKLINRVLTVLVIVFAYGFRADKWWLLALTTALLIIWGTRSIIYKQAFRHLIHAAFKHEDLLCILWNCGSSIAFFNGNRYWKDFKIEDGKYIHYKDKEKH